MDRNAIQIQAKALRFDQALIAELRSEFREAHWVRIPQLLDPSLLDFLRQRLESDRWQTMLHPGIGEEYISIDLPALGLLSFAVNRPRFLAAVEEITGCTPLQWFQGRVYRMTAGAGHYDSWHNDVDQYKRVGMSLNLSASPFHGGLFLLRESVSGRMLAEVPNTGLGDALIFRISDKFEHRVSDLEGNEPKTAFAGWFRTDLPELFEGLTASSSTPAGPSS